MADLLSTAAGTSGRNWIGTDTKWRISSLLRKGLQGETGRGRTQNGGSPLYCGRDLRMALTSSATVVKANSNCSWREKATVLRGNERPRFCRGPRPSPYLGLDHARPLVPQVLQSRRDVDLLRSCTNTSSTVKTSRYVSEASASSGLLIRL